MIRQLFLLFSLLSIAVSAQEAHYACGSDEDAISLNTAQRFDFARLFVASQDINFNEQIAAESNVPYNKFEIAVITYKNSSKKVLARYNPLSQEIEVRQQENGAINILMKKDGVVLNFKNSGETYLSAVFINENNKQDIGYFASTRHNNNLLKKTVYKFIKAKTAKTSYDSAKPAHYKEMTSYFYADSTNKLVQLSTKKKIIKKEFPNNSKEIISFIRKHNLSNDKPGNLSKLMAYVSSLDSNKQLHSRSTTFK